MSQAATLEMIQQIIDSIEPVQTSRKKVRAQAPQQLTELTRSLAGLPPETPEEIKKLRSALGYLSPDARRGQGSFFLPDGSPGDYWLGAVWAIRSLGWDCGEDIARQWSMGIQRIPYDEDAFQEAWDSYNPQRPNPVGIGSLYLCAKRLGWQQSPATSHAPETNSLQLASWAQAYRLYTAQDLLSFPVASYKVKGIFPDVGLGTIYGSSGSGKSFLSLELGACINQGVEFFGIKTQPCDVTYICLEGEGGLQRRVRAWEAAHGKPMPSGVKFIIQPFEMMRAEQVDLLIQALPKGGVVFIDTLNRAAPAADENSSRDMGIILEAAKTISREVAGLVLLVHHTGKDASRGMRGHSSLFAALDGVIEVSRDASGNRSWSVAKSKDGEDGKEVKFRLQTHVLGQDSDGEDITSCTVTPDNSALFVTRQPNGKVQQAALARIKLEINASRFKGKCTSGKDTKCLRVEDAITAVANTLTTTASNKRRNRAKQLVTGLIAGNYLSSALQNDEGWLWLG
jgi:hypothetical protein